MSATMRLTPTVGAHRETGRARVGCTYPASYVVVATKQPLRAS